MIHKAIVLLSGCTVYLNTSEIYTGCEEIIIYASN